MIGGDEEAATKLNTGAAFAFGDPFGVLFKEGVEFFASGNFTPFQEAVADEKDVFDEKVLPINKGGPFKALDGVKGFVTELLQGGAELFFKLIELGKVGDGALDDAVLFVGSSAFAGAGADSHGGFDGALPMGFFTPAGEAGLSGEAAGEVDDFTRGVPGEVQVGGEVDVGFKNVAIDFDLVRFLVFFEGLGDRGGRRWR